MFAPSSFWKMKRAELERRRRFLLTEPETKPAATISTELKLIEDEIAECTKRIELDRTKAVPHDETN